MRTSDTTVKLGDWVRLEDGREGQVWDEPDWQTTVALGDSFETVYTDKLAVVDRVLPDRQVDRTARVVKARKVHTCGCSRPHYAGDHTCIGIRPKQQYVHSVLFPGDINSSGQPWVMKLCLPCARQYDDTDPARLAVKAS